MHLVLEAIPFVCLVKLPFDTTFPIQVRFNRVGIAPRLGCGLHSRLVGLILSLLLHFRDRWQNTIFVADEVDMIQSADVEQLIC